MILPKDDRFYLTNSYFINSFQCTKKIREGDWNADHAQVVCEFVCENFKTHVLKLWPTFGNFMLHACDHEKKRRLSWKFGQGEICENCTVPASNTIWRPPPSSEAGTTEWKGSHACMRAQRGYSCKIHGTSADIDITTQIWAGKWRRLVLPV